MPTADDRISRSHVKYEGRCQTRLTGFNFDVIYLFCLFLLFIYMISICFFVSGACTRLQQCKSALAHRQRRTTTEPFPIETKWVASTLQRQSKFLDESCEVLSCFLFLFCFAFLVFDPQYLESNVGVGLHTSNWAHWITSNRRQPSKPEDSDQVWMTPLLFVLFVIFNPFHLSSSYFPLPLFPLLFDLLFFPFFL